MLQDIHSDTLAHLLTSVTHLRHGPIQISALDGHLFSNDQVHPAALPSLNPGDIIEIQGPPSSGKTHVLYFLLISCLAPCEYRSTVLGGWGKAGIVFDMDGSFDILRFRELLVNHLNRLLTHDIRAAQHIAQTSLEMLHIFRPTSSSQLIATISHLGKYHTDHLPRAKIGLVAVDSLNAHFWPDRFIVEQTRANVHSHEREREFMKPAPPLHRVLTALEQFRRSHGAVVAITNWGIHSSNTDTRPIYEQRSRLPSDPFPEPRATTVRPWAAINNMPSSSANMLNPNHHMALFIPAATQIPGGIPPGEVEVPRNAFTREREDLLLVWTPRRSIASQFIFRIAVGDAPIT